MPFLCALLGCVEEHMALPPPPPAHAPHSGDHLHPRDLILSLSTGPGQGDMRVSSDANMAPEGNQLTLKSL